MNNQYLNNFKPLNPDIPEDQLPEPQNEFQEYLYELGLEYFGQGED